MSISWLIPWNLLFFWKNLVMNCLTLWNICFFIYISYLFKRKRTWEAARTYDRHLHKTYLIPIWYKRYDLSFSHGAGALWTDGLKTEQWWRMDENVYKVSIYLEYIFFYESRLLRDGRKYSLALQLEWRQVPVFMHTLFWRKCR